MIVKKNLNLFKAIPYVRYELLFSLVVSLTVYLVYEVGDQPHFSLPNVLPSVLGAALAIFLGFRSSVAHARWGQAALAWGGIQNSVRIFGRLIVTFSESHRHTPTYDAERTRVFQKEMIYRLIAFVTILRMKLRDQSEWKLAIKDFLSEQEYEQVVGKTNPLLALLVLQGHQIYNGMRDGTLMGFDSFQMEGQMAQLSALSVQCEHIKAIPIPRQYTFFTRLFVWFFLLIIPFSFVKTFDDYFEDHQGSWLIIPVSLLMAFVYGIVERTGAVNENPFENLITDVPLSWFCTEMERDLRETLGETKESFPSAAVPDTNGYLF